MAMVKAVLPLFPACPVVDGMKVGKRTSGVWSAGSLVLRRCLCEVTQPVRSYSLVALQSERFCCRFVTKVKAPCWAGVVCWCCVLPGTALSGGAFLPLPGPQLCSGRFLHFLLGVAAWCQFLQYRAV